MMMIRVRRRCCLASALVFASAIVSPAASQDSADVARVRTELDVVGDTAVAVVWQLLDRMALRADNQVHHAETWVTQRETWLREGNRNDPPA